MFYYKVAVLSSSLKPLTYSSNNDIAPYCLVKVLLKTSLKTAVVLEKVEKTNFVTKEIEEILNSKFSFIQIELAKFISYYYVCEIGVAFGIFEPLVEPKFKQIEFTKEPNLSQKQQEAYEFASIHNSSLLFGDTGSGKSEIYIKLITKTLNQGKQALFLMPEISLTPQMQKRLEEYFGSHIGIWHSKITPKKKTQILEKFQNGEIKLIAGARSALFLPFVNLGIIIVDEEHDDSYKSAHKPRYNARDLALFLSSKLDIKVVLGSATPSLTTYKKQPTFRLNETFFQSQKSFLYDISETKITSKIKNELKTTLEKGKQAIVFLPTRANFKYMICLKCSAIVTCPFCSVGMSFHKDKNALKCHYCGFSTYAKVTCAKCGSEILEAKRMGTSEVLDELRALFPTANIAKFDRDEITTQKKLVNLLKDFNEQKIDILVGTQMLSKGHDYHNVELAVIMGIDENLSYADFRAREKTLALAIQIAGRAGRAGVGRVLLQTKQEEFFKNYISDYDKFLNDEDEFRDGLYPPYKRLLRVLISHKNAETAKNSMDSCLLNLKNIANIEIIGYGRATIEYIASKYRYEILVRADSHKPIIQAARACANIANAEVDVDAINFS
ncbi:primosomal protein N' [Campylobacter geochelonis]|uniref:primosomal protein N' n=1 Tax=Campylobacter geochelonis TaxID=1780362 RepID=UPI000770B17E|nr:primosomal protein N' [Campylobacter geochelonis]CZE51497.1 primosome assembly protein PriA [Campylobacter geochelonis]